MYNILMLVDELSINLPSEEVSINEFINLVKSKIPNTSDDYILISRNYEIDGNKLNHIKDKLRKYYSSGELPDVLIFTDRNMDYYIRSTREIDRVLIERINTSNILIRSDFWHKLDTNNNINCRTNYGLEFLYLIMLAHTNNWLYIDNPILSLHRMYCASKDVDDISSLINIALAYLLKDKKNRRNLIKHYLLGIEND